MTYDDVVLESKNILKAVSSNFMPHGITARANECTPPGTFLGPSRWSQSQIEDFRTWIENGTPEGDSKTASDTEKVKGEDNEGLGAPDLIIENSANGFDVGVNDLNNGRVKNVLRNFPIRVPFNEERYLVAVKILTDNKNEVASTQQQDGQKFSLQQVFHHAHLFYDEEGKSVKMNEDYHRIHQEDHQDGFEGDENMPRMPLGAWFPGGGPTHYRSGTAAKIKPGAYFILQVHYALYNKKPFHDKTRFALWFSHQPISKIRRGMIVKNESFTIPAGDQNFQVSAEKVISRPFTIYSMLPHLHQLGTDFWIKGILPNHEEKCLADVEWDFNHQNELEFRTPVSLPAGTTLSIKAKYDNSFKNPNQFQTNLNDIPWGEESDREMMLSMFSYSYDDEKLVPSEPKISDVKIENESTLSVSFTNTGGVKPGAWIELNGRFLTDSVVDLNQGTISSADQWKRAFLDRKVNSFTVVNPDTGRSNELQLKSVRGVQLLVQKIQAKFKRKKVNK